MLRLLLLFQLGLAGFGSVCLGGQAVRIVPFASMPWSFKIALRAPHDGSGRLFVLQQTGEISVLDRTGKILGTYLTVEVDAPGETGLFGMAFDPNFGRDPDQPGYHDFYLAFTAPKFEPALGSSADQVIRRYRISNPRSNDASDALASDVIHIPAWGAFHRGGDLHFGPDGYLYYGMGDSGLSSYGVTQTTGRTEIDGHIYYLQGTMLRLDVRHATPAAGLDMCGAIAGQAAQYSIPPGNPFAGSSTECGEIWAYGFRNPFRWSFDRGSGDLWIGDVGEAHWEEIDRRTPDSTDGINYGWNLCEGDHAFPNGASDDCPAVTNTTAPVIAYEHIASNCAVTGGFLYRGPIQSLQGIYIYGDSCSSNIWFATFDGAHWQSTVFDTLPGGYGTVVSFGEDEAGNLYVVHQDNDTIYRFARVDITTHVVTPIAHSGGSLYPGTPQTVEEGDTVAFTVKPEFGYAIGDVNGCGGTLIDETFTTAPISADCTVNASFLPGDRVFADGFESPSF